ncbi:putative membrane protein [Propionispora sp. 2/2-37]|uniref:undecaprenyl-phosphate galactose phosphotransferase WbaP n=1 Tax=Propionispora sp. 2/2-37 TaxID=1677858 RepID=UPI0006BB8AB1|nr:undecaprenyl-phosphate galactose phosphotransferase WbaP [Propionispora sp. 2/2-37]CUH94495.1 putative membrane protein [Propionispora sp. 2/2-37]
MPSSVKSVSVEQYQIPTVSLTSRIGRYLAPVILLGADYVSITFAIITSWYLRANLLPRFFESLDPFHLSNKYLYFIVPITYIVFLAYEGLYVKRLPFWKSAELLFKICSYVSALTIVIMYFTEKSNDVSRIFVLLVWSISFFYLAVSRYFSKYILTYFGLWKKPVVVIGAGKTAEILATSFASEPYLGYKIVGLIEDNYMDRPLIQEYPHIGVFANAENVILKSGVQDVIIAAPGLERENLLALIYRIQPHVKNVTIVPDLFGIPLSNIEVETLFNEKTVMLKMRNNLTSLRNRIIKRIFDVVVGAAILLMSLPIFLAVGLTIRLDSRGPILHIAKRLGKDGKKFNCYKFRTMFLNADRILETYFADNPEAQAEWNKFAKLKNYDPRITRVGVWLRKYSLDELPQIVNVMLGNMSLVGPRPYLPREKERMGYAAHTIFKTVPGITGLWQVSGRNSIDFNGRIQLDSWYVRNWSLWHDVVILLKTLKVVVEGKGAY